MMIGRIENYTISQLLDKWGIRHQHRTSVKLKGRIKTLEWNMKSDKNLTLFNGKMC